LERADRSLLRGAGDDRIREQIGGKSLPRCGPGVPRGDRLDRLVALPGLRGLQPRQVIDTARCLVADPLDVLLAVEEGEDHPVFRKVRWKKRR